MYWVVRKQLERSIVLESGEGDKLAQNPDKQKMKIIKNKKADPIIFKILIRCGMCAATHFEIIFQSALNSGWINPLYIFFQNALNLGQSQDTKKPQSALSKFFINMTLNVFWIKCIIRESVDTVENAMKEFINFV